MKQRNCSNLNRRHLVKHGVPPSGRGALNAAGGTIQHYRYVIDKGLLEEAQPCADLICERKSTASCKHELSGTGMQQLWQLVEDMLKSIWRSQHQYLRCNMADML